MALYQPGKRSNLTFLISSISTISLLFILIAGHLVIGLDVWLYITKGTDMAAVSAMTGLPTLALWLSVLAALLMDIWVFIHMRKGHQKAKRR